MFFAHIPLAKCVIPGPVRDRGEARLLPHTPELWTFFPSRKRGKGPLGQQTWLRPQLRPVSCGLPTALVLPKSHLLLTQVPESRAFSGLCLQSICTYHLYFCLFPGVGKQNARQRSRALACPRQGTGTRAEFLVLT